MCGSLLLLQLGLSRWGVGVETRTLRPPHTLVWTEVVSSGTAGAWGQGGSPLCAAGGVGSGGARQLREWGPGWEGCGRFTGLSGSWRWVGAAPGTPPSPQEVPAVGRGPGNLDVQHFNPSLSLRRGGCCRSGCPPAGAGRARTRARRLPAGPRRSTSGSARREDAVRALRGRRSCVPRATVSNKRLSIFPRVFLRPAGGGPSGGARVPGPRAALWGS